MLRYPAVELFADRAEAVLPDFSPWMTATPAAVAGSLSPAGRPAAGHRTGRGIAVVAAARPRYQRLHGPWLLSTDGLRDVPARQKTLACAIGWS